MEGSAMPWEALSHDEKLDCIRAVVATDIEPQLQRDGGGVDVVDLVNGKEVTITYRGACAGCPMAFYGTLGFIQQVLSTKVHSSLVVMPSLTNLPLSDIDDASIREL